MVIFASQQRLAHMNDLSQKRIFNCVSIKTLMSDRRKYLARADRAARARHRLQDRRQQQPVTATTGAKLHQLMSSSAMPEQTLGVVLGNMRVRGQTLGLVGLFRCKSACFPLALLRPGGCRVHGEGGRQRDAMLQSRRAVTAGQLRELACHAQRAHKLPTLFSSKCVRLMV